jgi:hypothetical protein
MATNGNSGASARIALAQFFPFPVEFMLFRGNLFDETIWGHCRIFSVWRLQPYGVGVIASGHRAVFRRFFSWYASCRWFPHNQRRRDISR